MTKELVGRQLELMKRHGTEPVVVNTLQANDRSLLRNTKRRTGVPGGGQHLEEKTLATADLAR